MCTHKPAFYLYELPSMFYCSFTYPSTMVHAHQSVSPAAFHLLTKYSLIMLFVALLQVKLCIFNKQKNYKSFRELLFTAREKMQLFVKSWKVRIKSSLNVQQQLCIWHRGVWVISPLHETTINETQSDSHYAQ